MLATSRNQQWQAVALGQGQEPKALNLLKTSSTQGFWALIANLHLCVKWLPELEKAIFTTIDAGPNKAFRVFLSSSPTPLFPIQLLQASIKMTCEPPKGLKPNIVRLLQNMPEEEYNRIHDPQIAQKYRKLFFSLVWFHSVLLERRKFKMLGWNVPYDFNDSDFEICENLLAMYLEENPTDIPWDAIRYLIAEANYGGRVTEHPDNRILRAYAAEYFSANALMPKFMLSALPTYYIPEDNTLTAYKGYARDLPLMDFPEVFGWDEVADRNAADPSPLKVCLLQEIERYNALLKKLKASNKILIKGIQGFVVISKEQEQVMMSLFAGQVPPAWLTAYPSLKPLGSWTPDLIERIAQLNF